MIRTSLLAFAALTLLPLAVRAEKLAGEVAFTGAVPPVTKLHREADPVCAKKAMNDESVLVANGKLANVWIHVVKGAAEGNAAANALVVEIDQTDCTYIPRVTVAQVGQKVISKNNDPTLHNVHARVGATTVFNKGMPNEKSKPVEYTTEREGVVSLKCDVHPWMRGYVGVNKNPYQAVTDASGAFQIELPPGSYTVEAWHEKFGVKSGTVTVEKGKPAKLDFKYDGTEKAG